MIFKDKKGFLARDWIIGTILFSGIIALFVLAAGGMVDEYGTPNVTSPAFEQTFDRLSNHTHIAGKMWNATSSEEGLSTVGTFTLLFSSTFEVIRLVFNSVGLAGKSMFGFTEYFGVDSTVAFTVFTIAFACLSVVIVFIVISSLSRRDL